MSLGLAEIRGAAAGSKRVTARVYVEAGAFSTRPSEALLNTLSGRQPDNRQIGSYLNC
jgi:hypothetical protein